ncbi:UDP-N-acetylglucosamine/UDP-N-acetylgalactosaminediphosphorylase [Anaerocolumna jejuensis DSM 15929]|uniref:UDP-N-acetylglucosamine/UDP-N-acetylgalactosamine diphosphorylase n=1 Tax=Anaerocolumna jejuensis DSM 15929 TaxID=1121322 RepID=A0A1M7DMW1_9FIRM|nr:UTP--glucose-1-phosphate uridylyltransferase [Anaerocolumna jejuensis]SHL80509.1 UDP-N-acetylglucosamine/UDP-N-acetylgalactosaminediphosphorylase [Anaerocolumna jejuensis DSM 15929]
MKNNEFYEQLKKYNQLHLLRYFNDINEEEKECLINQVNLIDFSILDNYSKKNIIAKKGNIEPINVVSIDEIEQNKEVYFNTGIDVLKRGKVGAILLAGGQGTRLGFDKPKGTLNVGITKELYLFEILINNLLEVVKITNRWIHLAIMTSFNNNKDTQDFFKQHNYFGYNKKYITFFIQEMAPAIDFNGKIFLEEKYKVALSPNGNGGWFTSLEKAGVLTQLKEDGVEWLNIFSVDNVMQKIADPYFVGATIIHNCVSGSKVVSKVSPEEKVGVLCLEDGKPSIIEYYEMTNEMLYDKDKNGNYKYNYGVILNYLFNIEAIEQNTFDNMPIHMVEKKIDYINDEEKIVKPEKPNGYKFETLVLDMIHMLDNCLAYEVIRNKEFAPIKNKEGVDSLLSARKIMSENGISL